ncbi:hypothetical protein ACIQG8_01355 [Pseudarthrobacter oxydans]|uniref:hypothetical protein n=1 Tax=Pseudarthrobacter oxydans TaxID=1671 RepID=UPI00381119B0
MANTRVAGTLFLTAALPAFLIQPIEQVSSQNFPSIYARLRQIKWLSQDFLRIVALRLVLSTTPVQGLVSVITTQLQSFEVSNEFSQSGGYAAMYVIDVSVMR